MYGKYFLFVRWQATARFLSFWLHAIPLWDKLTEITTFPQTKMLIGGSIIGENANKMSKKRKWNTIRSQVQTICGGKIS